MGVPPAMPRAAERVRATLCLPPAEGRVHLIYMAATSYRTAQCSCADGGAAKRATPSLQTHAGSALQLPGCPERSSRDRPRLLHPPQEMSETLVVLWCEAAVLGLEPATVS